MLKPAVYSVMLTRAQSRQLRSSTSIQVWSRFEAYDLVRVVFRVLRPYDWTFRAQPHLTDGVHEQLAELTTAGGV